MAKTKTKQKTPPTEAPLAGLHEVEAAQGLAPGVHAQSPEDVRQALGVVLDRIPLPDLWSPVDPFASSGFVWANNPYLFGRSRMS